MKKKMKEIALFEVSENLLHCPASKSSL